MTNVRLIKNDDEYLVEAKGHATGSVEVCSAVSTLMYTMLGFVHNEPSYRVQDYKMEDGYSYIKWKSDNDFLYKLAEVGFMQLSIDNSEYIDIHFI